MFENLIHKVEHEIRGTKFTFSEFSSEVYIKEILSEDETELLTGRKLAETNMKFAGKVVAHSLAVHSDKNCDEIYEDFLKAPRALQDDLYNKAAEINGLNLVQQATKGKASLGEDSPES